MIALSFALVALSLMLGGALIAAIRWEHNAVAERDSALTLLDDERKVSAEYKSQRDVGAAELTVKTDELATTKARLEDAELQLNEALKRARAYFTRSLKSGSTKDVDDAMADVFGSPVRSVSPQVPAPRLSDTADGALEKP